MRLYCQSQILGADGGYNGHMQRNSNVSQGLLILLVLAFVIFAPVIASGYLDLHLAEASTDPTRAASFFEAAAERLFWRSDLWERAGLSALKAGQPQEALRLLKQAPQLSIRGLTALGVAYTQTDQLDLALAAYRSALNQGASAEIYSGLANVQRLRGDVEAERTALQNQLLLKPEDAPAQYRLGLLLSLVDINAALTHLQLASQLDPEFAPVFDTLRSAMTLAELSPTEAGRLVALGRGLGLVNEWPLASRAFESAVKADERNAEALAWLGEAKQHIGQDGGADLNQALVLNPQSVVVRGLRGLYWKRLGTDHQALVEYQAAAVIDPDNHAWSSSLGETYARLGDLVSALASFQRATELAPTQAVYWRLLATFCVEYAVHVQDVGLPAAQKAADLSPKDAQTLDVLGWSQLSLGKFYTAEQTLLAALKLAPDYALVRLHLAMTYLQEGKRTEAYDQLRRAVELDPNGTAGQQAAQVLKKYFP